VRQKISKKKLDVGILHTTKLVYLGYKHENFCCFQIMLLRVLRYLTIKNYKTHWTFRFKMSNLRNIQKSNKEIPFY
jgi:hypothetical protein